MVILLLINQKQWTKHNTCTGDQPRLIINYQRLFFDTAIFFGVSVGPWFMNLHNFLIIMLFIYSTEHF